MAVVRPYIAQQMASLLTANYLHSGSHNKNGVCEVLYAAAWIVGEFSSALEDPLSVLESLLQPRVTALPGHIQAVFVHNTLKLYATVVKELTGPDGENEDSASLLRRMSDVALQRLPLFVQSGKLSLLYRLPFINSVCSAPCPPSPAPPALLCPALPCSSLPCLLTAGDLEVQERAVTALETLKYLSRKREQGRA